MFDFLSLFSGGVSFSTHYYHQAGIKRLECVHEIQLLTFTQMQNIINRKEKGQSERTFRICEIMMNRRCIPVQEKRKRRGKDEGRHERNIKQIVFLCSLCMCMWKEKQGKKRKHLGRIRSSVNRHVSQQLLSSTVSRSLSFRFSLLANTQPFVGRMVMAKNVFTVTFLFFFARCKCMSECSCSSFSFV